VTRPFFLPARRGDPDGFIVNVSPELAQWDYSSLRVVEIGPGATFSWHTGDAEWLVLPLAGSFEVRCSGAELALEGRTSVFDRVTDFAYVPRDATVDVTSRAGGRFALPGARARRALPFRYGAADQVPVEIRGSGNATRQATNFCSPTSFETDRLCSVEVLTPGGNWSSYPPHKHDELGPDEAVLEEIYYFEVRGGAADGLRGPGGYQRAYGSAPGKEIDLLEEVHNGDTMLIPFGYHGPTMAAPGYELYFLNVLAGPADERSMSFCDDPAHEWVRASWKTQVIDPRVPLTSHQGRLCD
jgi:5-deoxy-glucuronate isomerase